MSCIYRCLRLGAGERNRTLVCSLGNLTLIRPPGKLSITLNFHGDRVIFSP